MINPLWCSHSTTTEPDEKGKGICLQCGSLLQLQLTLEFFNKTMEAMRKAEGW